jgi:hypothetical protein
VPSLCQNATVRLLRRRRADRRLRPLGEAECYGRAYGERTEDVKIVKLEPRRPRFTLKVSGEDLRRRFQERLDGRESTQG